MRSRGQGLRVPSRTTDAERAADQARRDADYQEFVANREKHAAAWRQYYIDLDAWQTRQRMKALKATTEAEVARLGDRLALLTKDIDSAEKHLRHISGNERKRRFAEAETAKKLASLGKTTEVIADAVVKAKVEKAVTASRGVRKTVIRDKNTNRIVGVEETPL